VQTSSADRAASIDADRCAGDEVRGVRGQEDRRPGDFLRQATAPGRGAGRVTISSFMAFISNSGCKKDGCFSALLAPAA
jgi:hypothetical protein